jgi:hypothetical protein
MNYFGQGSRKGWKHGFRALMAAGIVVSCASIGTAEAAARKKHPAPTKEAPLVIKRKRGFLESGNVVPLGSQSNYVGQSNTGASGAYSHSGAFGTEALPRRYDVPQGDPLIKF